MKTTTAEFQRLRRKKSNELSLGEAIDLFLDQSGLRGLLLIHRIQSEWTAVVGEMVAAATLRVEHRNGVFIIHLKSPNWKNELMYHRTAIKERINEYAGEAVCTDVWIA
jgi:predicted nucleic acid-binding Zn ribbon protein